jgi:hypothetical protein
VTKGDRPHRPSQGVSLEALAFFADRADRIPHEADNDQGKGSPQNSAAQQIKEGHADSFRQSANTCKKKQKE